MNTPSKFGVFFIALSACAGEPTIETSEQSATVFDCSDPGQRLTCAPPGQSNKKFICHATGAGDYKKLSVSVNANHHAGESHGGNAPDQNPGASANDLGGGTGLDCECAPRACENDCTGATPGDTCEDDNECTGDGTCSASGCQAGPALPAGTACGDSELHECNGAGTCVEYPNVVVNEVESNGGTRGDWIELYNAGSTPADISGFSVLDADDTHTPYVIPAGTVIPVGGTFIVEEAQLGFGLGGGDSARLFNPNGTLVDSYTWTAHAVTTYGRCPNGTGSFTTQPTSTKNAPNDCSIPLKLNEVESNGGNPGDWVEYLNVSAIPVDVSGFVFKDADDSHAYVIPAGTIVAAGGYLVLEEAQFDFGLGGTESARLFDTNGNIVDAYNWTSHAAVTYGRCPNGTGDFTDNTTSTKGAPNDCGPGGPSTADPWPGRNAVVVVDETGTFVGNMSGLFYEPAAGADILWAVRNGPSQLYKLTFNGTNWVPEAGGGWDAGKTLHFPDGSDEPDTEDITRADLSTQDIYAVTERNNIPGNVSRPSILRFDLSQPGVDLDATHEWNLASDLPVVGANIGLEGIAWIPDSALTAAGFFDERLGHTYNPAEYPGHGTGLFFVGLEADGNIYGYALNHIDGTFARVATFASGDPTSKALSYDRDVGYLWSTCSAGCANQTSVLAIDTTPGSPTQGRFVLLQQFLRPSSMDNVANEGLAITPETECVGGQKPFFWADDGDTNGHSLRADTIPCGPFIP